MEKNLILFDHIKNHEWEDVKNILSSDEYIDVNIKDTNNNSLITYAILYNNPEITLLLLERDTKIDIIDDDGKSILYIPIKYNYDEIVDLLLEYNEKIIGESILDIYDNNGNIPLYYALFYKNIRAINKILNYQTNFNIKNKKGYSTIHLAIYTKSLEICHSIINHITNINIQSKTGETALHISCNMELREITELLLNKNANPNIIDYEYGITPLIYATYQMSNNYIVQLLINNNADPNIQDFYGNTALHYSIKENNVDIFRILVNYPKINVNMYNMDGNIPLHNVFNLKNIDDYIPSLIKKTNLNIQNNNFVSCLHLIAKTNIWERYKNILISKRMNIFLIDSSKKNVVDYIKDTNKFIDFISDSYIYQLKNIDVVWDKEWEKICGKKNFMKEDIKKLKNIIQSPNNDSKHIDKTNGNKICKKIIIRKIKNILGNNIGKEKCRNRLKSYPVKKSNICIKLQQGSLVDHCTFTGLTIDILIGLIYLLEKYKFICSVISNDIIANNKLCNYYSQLGIPIKSRCKFINFEIIWSNYKLFLSDDFRNRFEKCIKNKNKKYVIIPLYIELSNGYHSNYLIYDINKKEIERFEPHGSHEPYGYNYNALLLDKLLENKLKKIVNSLKYIPPNKFLPRIGFQNISSHESNEKKLGDPSGFCVLWSIWYVDMRMKYKEVNRKELVSNMIIEIREQNISFRNMIRNYSYDLMKLRDDILFKAGININDWYNDKYTEKQLNIIIKEINSRITRIIPS